MTTFADELNRAMTARGMRPVDLVRETGVSKSTLVNARRGHGIPDQQTITLLSEALYWPNLLRVASRERTAECRLCGATFVRPARASVKTYCSRACTRTAHARRQREAARTRTLTETRLTRARLEDHRAAVAAFCADCTAGESICRDADCRLRPVSPLPFVPLTAITRRKAA